MKSLRTDNATDLFETLRSHALFAARFKSRDLPKRIITGFILAIALVFYVTPWMAILFCLSVLGIEFTRWRMTRRLPDNAKHVRDAQVVGFFALDVISTTAYCLPALAFVASGSLAGLLLGLLWLAAVTIHNVAGLALIKLWCWAAIAPVAVINAAAFWLALHQTYAPIAGWDAHWVAFGTFVYFANMLEVTFRQRHNRDAFERAQRAAEEHLGRLEYLARHDVMTGLMNRSAFEETLSDAISAPAGDGPVGVILMDLDKFKRTNDTFGHAAGDAVLVAVAERVGEVFEKDLGARLGGDEFAVILNGKMLRDVAMKRAGELKARLHEPVWFEDICLDVGASLGVAFCDPDETLTSLCKRADQAMYEAKSAAAGYPVLAA